MGFKISDGRFGFDLSIRRKLASAVFLLTVAGCSSYDTPDEMVCLGGIKPPSGYGCPSSRVGSTDLVFSVFFRDDNARLSREAQAIIGDRAQEALKRSINRVIVQGKTDSAGSSKANRKLSRQRAIAVKEALVANGVPEGKIAIRPLGEKNPARLTGDGISEAVNRRTDIIIEFNGPEPRF